MKHIGTNTALRKAIKNGNYSNIPGATLRKDIKRRLILECDAIDDCITKIAEMEDAIQKNRNNIRRLCEDWKI